MTSAAEGTGRPPVNAGRLDDVPGLRDVLASIRAEQGALAEAAYMLGVVRAAIFLEDGPAEERLARARRLFEAHMAAGLADEHGAFSLCQVDQCGRCSEAMRAVDLEWTAGLSAQGVDLHPVADMTPAERAEHDKAQEAADMAAEHLAAAGGPDPDYGRDLDDD